MIKMVFRKLQCDRQSRKYGQFFADCEGYVSSDASEITDGEGYVSSEIGYHISQFYGE